jgi:acyl transferase domain-containing protein
MLACSNNAVGEVPRDRWNLGAIQTDSEAIDGRARYGGFARRIQLVDHALFGISPAEVGAMDPHQRLLLERGYSALHLAGFERSALLSSLTGVFIGAVGSEFGELLAASPAATSVYAATGASSSIGCVRACVCVH